MSAVELRELHPERAVAQQPLGDGDKGIPLYNGVGLSWAAARRACTERFSDSVSPSAALIQRKLPTHDTAKLGAEVGLQWRDDVLDHIVESNVPFVRTCIGDKGTHQQFLCPCNGGNALIPQYLGSGVSIIVRVVIELVVDPCNLVTDSLPYLGVWSVVVIWVLIGCLWGMGDDVLVRWQESGKLARQLN